VIGLLLNALGAGLLAWIQSEFGDVIKTWLGASDPAKGARVPLLPSYDRSPFTVRHYAALTVSGWALIVAGIVAQLFGTLLAR
jgi:hypothetical protein